MGQKDDRIRVPAYLAKGDTILLIATARKISEEELNPAISELKKWGLKVELGPNIYKSRHQFAGTDQQRAADLQWAIDHPKAKAILIARGGYGTIRIMDKEVHDLRKHLAKVSHPFLCDGLPYPIRLPLQRNEGFRVAMDLVKDPHQLVYILIRGRRAARAGRRSVHRAAVPLSFRSASSTAARSKRKVRYPSLIPGKRPALYIVRTAVG